MNIKGFDRNMKCYGNMQFEVGKKYKTGAKHITVNDLCSDKVIHFCKSFEEVNKYYSCLPEDENRFCEIKVLGEEVTDGSKCGTNHIKILREIKGEELAIALGKVNGNTGIFNSGDWNSGDWNSGNRNSGNRNNGYGNSGNWNSGNWNSGNSNSGDENIGDRNSGDRNSGYGNSCNYSNGVFCNKNDKHIRIFNEPSNMSLNDWYGSKFYNAIISVPFNLTEWVENSGGKLVTYTYKEAWANWWIKLSDENKKIIQEIPNFDADIFEDITGINVRK